MEKSPSVEIFYNSSAGGTGDYYEGLIIGDRVEKKCYDCCFLQLHSNPFIIMLGFIFRRSPNIILG